uniref:Uncharacterized protein n=1 Tax=Lactuca sativa TaxID=4236 RepID=A0A9R1W630_LACSA|nr:hypothetical protein LSAT_V11C300144940 [Lactuca sativa]
MYSTYNIDNGPSGVASQDFFKCLGSVFVLVRDTMHAFQDFEFTFEVESTAFEVHRHKNSKGCMFKIKVPFDSFCLGKCCLFSDRPIVMKSDDQIFGH